MSKLTSDWPFLKTFSVVKCAKLPERKAMRDQFQKKKIIYFLTSGELKPVTDLSKTAYSTFCIPHLFFPPRKWRYWIDLQEIFSRHPEFLKNTILKMSYSRGSTKTEKF